MYEDLQSAYAAGVGFNSKSASWQATQVYLGDELRDSDQKDPTIQAIGIGGQVYGARADLIILDDCVTMSNAHEYEKQIPKFTPFPWGKDVRGIEDLRNRPDFSPSVIWRKDYGVADYVDRVSAIGNGQIPRVAATAWRVLNDIHGHF